MDMKIAFAAVVLLAFAGVGYMLFSGSGATGASPTYAQGNGNYNGGCGMGGCAMMGIDNSIPEANGQQAAAGQASGAQAGELQIVSVHALSTGLYDHPTLTVKAGVPVRLDFTAEPGSGCGAQLILDGVGTPVNLVSRNGQTVSATFTPPSPGQYRFHCGMNMFRGVLIAT